jgi:hypothetical protein
VLVMGWRSRLSRGVCAWFACLALQVIAVPAVEASTRPAAAACFAAAPAVKRQAAHEVAARAAPICIEDTSRRYALATSRQSSPPGTQTPRVRVERLYLRLLSIRC